MRFRQLDKITLLIPGDRIVAQKTLTGREDYLRDHFPRFPVQPGVLMLESLYQAAQLLVRATEEFRPGLVILREAKNVKFASFLQPGQSLLVEAEILKRSETTTTVKVSGKNSSGETCVAGRLVIDCISSDPTNPVDIHASRYMREISRRLQEVAIAQNSGSYNLAESH